MPTNKPTIAAFEILSELIDGLNTGPTQETIDQMKAWNRLLKRHMGQQKRQDGKWGEQSYTYDPDTREIVRRNEKGEEICRY
jgi:hypothetical protein